MKVLAGDWDTGINVAIKKTMFGKIVGLMFQKSAFGFETIPFNQLASAEVVTEDNHMSVGRKLGWGVGGALLLGPVGAVIGAVAGGNMKGRVIAVSFRDGRKVLIDADAKAAKLILAAGMMATPSQVTSPE